MCARWPRDNSTVNSGRRAQIFKEREGRRLVERAAQNHVVFCFHCRKAENGVKEIRGWKRIFRGLGIPKRER